MFNFAPKSKISVVKTVDSVEDSGIFKKIIVFALNLALFLGLSFFIHKLVYSDGSDQRIDQIAALSLAVFWACLLLISGLVLKFSEFLAIACFGVAAIFFPFFRFLSLGLMIIFAVLVVLAMVLMRQASKAAAENSLKFRSSLILSSSLPKIFFILSLLGALVFWSGKFSQGLNLKTSDLNPVLSSGFSLVYPEYSEKTTFGELVDKILEKQSSGFLGLVPGGLSPNLTKTIKLQARESLLSEISQLFGKKVSAKDSVSTILHSVLSSYYKSLSEITRRIVDFTILFVLFAFWFGIFQLFSFIFHITFWLALQLLLILKIIRINFISVEKEVITL